MHHAIAHQPINPFMKQFVVTGCSRGIGRATVEYLLAAGHQVHALSRNKDLQIPGATMHAVDLRSDDSIKAWARSMESSGSVIDALINNAGALVNKPFVSMERSDFHDMADVNWAGTAMLTQAALPLFSKKAHILNISSMGGYQGASKFPGLSAYASSKGALSILTECLQAELGPKGLIFNALCLGAVQTDMLEEAFPGLQAPVQPATMAQYVAEFALHGHLLHAGQVIPVTLGDPE